MEELDLLILLKGEQIHQVSCLRYYLYYLLIVPTAPQNVTYENTSSTTIRVSWTPPTDFNGPNEGYEVSYVRLETNVQNTTGRLTTTSVDIDNLEIYEEYNLTVAAFTDKGAGTSSEILSILTDEDCKFVNDGYYLILFLIQSLVHHSMLQIIL